MKTVFPTLKTKGGLPSTSDEHLRKNYLWYRYKHDGRIIPADTCMDKARTSVETGKRFYPSAYPEAQRSTDPDQTEVAFFDGAECPAGFRLVGSVAPDFRTATLYRRGGWQGQEGHGWHADEYGDSIISGRVYQLPARNGLARFVAGWKDSDGSLLAIDLSEIFEAAVGDDMEHPEQLEACVDAARAADGLARECADAEREWQTAWQAGNQFAALQGESHDLRVQMLAEFKEHKYICGVMGKPMESFPVHFQAFVKRVHQAREQLQAWRDEREQLLAGDHASYGFYPSSKLITAFKEGADIGEL